MFLFFLAATLKELVDPRLTHAQIRDAPVDCLASTEQRTEAQSILQRFHALRSRCQRYSNSLVTPMGDEMFYRYQQFLIDEATTALSALLERSAAGAPFRR